MIRISFNPTGVTAELRSLGRRFAPWLPGDVDAESGKFSKAPCTLDESPRYLSWSDPQQWFTFEQVAEADIQRRGWKSVQLA